MNANRHTPLKIRLWDRIEKGASGDCWIWRGVVTGGGYGAISYKGRTVKVHRLVYELLVGPIPSGLQLDHTCHTNDRACPGGFSCSHRLCVNPAHLEPVTPAENSRRAKLRLTHCHRGHEFNDVNTHVYGGRRKCRLCAVIYRRDAVERKRAALGVPLALVAFIVALVRAS